MEQNEIHTADILNRVGSGLQNNYNGYLLHSDGTITELTDNTFTQEEKDIMNKNAEAGRWEAIAKSYGFDSNVKGNVTGQVDVLGFNYRQFDLIDEMVKTIEKVEEPFSIIENHINTLDAHWEGMAASAFIDSLKFNIDNYKNSKTLALQVAAEIRETRIREEMEREAMAARIHNLPTHLGGM